MNWRLGLDLGTNSIGWAAVTLDDEEQPCGILDLGVRIFPDGRNITDETSNAATRRVARGQRRRRDRYLRRRAKLMQALINYSLMPSDQDGRKAIEHIAECDRQKLVEYGLVRPDECLRAARKQLNPYTLRALALDRPLQPYELGRALFHLDQRRGFRSNRKAGSDDDDAAKKIGPKIERLRQQFAERGARTLGEFLARQLKYGQPARFRPGVGFYPDRAMYQAEFAAIRQAQEPHQALSPEQWNTLRDIIFFQRRLKLVEPGWCRFEFEHGERRAAKALPVFQEYRLLQEVGDLKLHVGSGPEQPLNAGERARALERLRAGKDINLKKPVKALGLPAGATFNLSRGGRATVKGDEATARLIEQKPKGKPTQTLFGKRWLALSLDERNEIVRFLLDTEDPAVVHRKARQDWGLTDKQAQAVAHVSLPSGYGHLSEKAIGELLPYLRAGLGYSKAVRKAGYPHHSDFRNAEAHDRLPYYGAVLERDAVGADPKKDPQRDGEVARYGRFPNPTVHIGLNQLRHIVNRLITVYGKPTDIVVELARDLKENRKQRNGRIKQHRENERRNKKYREWLESEGKKATSKLLLKLRLWEEQGKPPVRCCPYTGKQLSCTMVIDEQETQIDHILPRSRTWDDSPANKVVCMAAANQVKDNQSPYDAFSDHPDYDYGEILARAATLPDNKKWRFGKNAMDRFADEDHFLGRQLNETRYLSQAARRYLAYLYDERAEGQWVRASPGRVTGLLRHAWGLPKNRDDHRHHAIDAFVVACTTEGLLKKFANAAKSDYRAEEKLTAVAKQVLPWQGFDHRQLQPFLNCLVVSHKPPYKPKRGTRGITGQTTGQLHEATALRVVGNRRVIPIKDSVRKPLSDVQTRQDLESVRDEARRAALLALWDQVKAEGRKPADFAEQVASKGALVNGRRQHVRWVRIDRAEKPYKGYLPGGNEFADVWQLRDESWKLVVVPTFDANQPGFDIERFRPVDKSGRRDPTARRLMRLRIDDMGVLGEGLERRIVRVRMMWTDKKRGGLVVLDDHNEAKVDARIKESRRRRREGLDHEDIKEHKYSARQLKQQGFRIVRVDEIGRMRDPGPRTP